MSRQKDSTKQYVWECERCGRKNRFRFFEHATSKIADDYCKGRVRRITWEKAW